ARHNGRAEYFVSPFPDVDLDKTLLLTVQDSAIHLLEVAHVSIDGYAMLAGFVFREANVRNFWIGVGAPGHVQRAHLLPTEEQRILNYNAGGKIRGMGEFPSQANVPDSVDARVGGLKVIVDLNALAIGLNVGSLQVQPLDIGRAS